MKQKQAEIEFATLDSCTFTEAQVGEVLEKFRDKYGAGVKAYYPKLDVAVEVPVQ